MGPGREPKDGFKTCAWHFTRLHHRCRTLFLPDSPVEGVGSLVRLAWDPRQGRASPVYVQDRVFLMQAGVACLGSERDEMIINEVVNLLKSTGKYRAAGRSKHCSGVSLPSTAPMVHGAQKKLESSGRFSGSLPDADAKLHLEPSDMAALSGQGVAKRKAYLRKRAVEAKPVTLPAAVRDAVQGSLSRKDGIVQPLAPTTSVLHARERNAADSVVRTKLTAWLNRERGQQWQREKEIIFRGDDDPSDDE